MGDNMVYTSNGYYCCYDLFKSLLLLFYYDLYSIQDSFYPTEKNIELTYTTLYDA